MKGMYKNVWKGVVFAYLMVLFWHSSGESEELHGNPQLG